MNQMRKVLIFREEMLSSPCEIGAPLDPGAIRTATTALAAGALLVFLLMVRVAWLARLDVG